MEEEDLMGMKVSVGLKANALVRSAQVFRHEVQRHPLIPEVAGNSLSKLHPLAHPTGQQWLLDFSWGPCCLDCLGRSCRHGDKAPAAGPPGQQQW